MKGERNMKWTITTTGAVIAVLSALTAWGRSPAPDWTTVMLGELDRPILIELGQRSVIRTPDERQGRNLASSLWWQNAGERHEQTCIEVVANGAGWIQVDMNVVASGPGSSTWFDSTCVATNWTEIESKLERRSPSFHGSTVAMHLMRERGDWNAFDLVAIRSVKHGLGEEDLANAQRRSLSLPFFPTREQSRAMVRIVNDGQVRGGATIQGIEDNGTKTVWHEVSLEPMMATVVRAREIRVDRGTSLRLSIWTSDQVRVSAYTVGTQGLLTPLARQQRETDKGHWNAEAASMEETVDFGRPSLMHFADLFLGPERRGRRSWLRIVNRNGYPANVQVRAIHDSGRENIGGATSFRINAESALTISASDIIEGNSVMTGQMNGQERRRANRWRVQVESRTNIDVVNMMSTPNGNLVTLDVERQRDWCGGEGEATYCIGYASQDG